MHTPLVILYINQNQQYLIDLKILSHFFGGGRSSLRKHCSVCNMIIKCIPGCQIIKRIIITDDLKGLRCKYYFIHLCLKLLTNLWLYEFEKKQFNLKTLLFMCELRIYFKDEADFEKIKNPTLPFFFSCHLCEFLTLLKQFLYFCCVQA